MSEIRSRIVTYDVGVVSIKQVRENVFTREQGVPVDIEIDGLDPEASHVLVFDAEEVIGTGRMLRDGHIGRIAVEKQYRGRGIGKIIVNELVRVAGNLQLPEVWLSSQCHAKAFYQKLGFFEVGDIYQEVDIDHIKMQKNL
jgi:predicted GNAT family N-acyltransferase